MYMLSYGEILEGDQKIGRSNEKQAFDIVIELLEAAVEKGVRSAEGELALTRVSEVWQFLIDDLIDPDNVLGDELRGSLISIGCWVIQQAQGVREGKSDDLQGIISVNKLIRDGLK